jgi:hypothetical protein
MSKFPLSSEPRLYRALHFSHKPNSIITLKLTQPHYPRHVELFPTTHPYTEPENLNKPRNFQCKRFVIVHCKISTFWCNLPLLIV